MIKFFRKIITGEKGLALPIVIGFLVLGGLMIAPSLDYLATCLNGSRIISKGIKGIYAADGGVNYAIWCLKHGTSPPQQLPENLNQMTVGLQVEDEGTYTLYFGQFIEARQHSNYLSVDGEVVWDEGANAYKYTITVQWQPESGYPVIHLEGIGVRLPLGYTYRPLSAASFPQNLSTDEPSVVTDGAGADMLNWEFDSPLPSVSETQTTKTQKFYMTGSGSQEGNYTWVIAARADVGVVSEITGTLYFITATARRLQSSETTAKIVADVIIGSETVYIISWQLGK